MENSKPVFGAIAAGLLITILCICVAAIGILGYLYYQARPLIPTGVAPEFPFNDPSTPTTEPQLTRPPVDTGSTSTIDVLESTIVPASDVIALACKFEDQCHIPATMTPPVAPRVVGETDTFWLSEISNNSFFEVDATLQYVTPHGYFWIENGVDYDQDELVALAETFESQIYPTNREFFGSEWSPGIDGDEHIYILYAGGAGFSILGYFSANDELHPLVDEHSNAHEMFLFNSDIARLGDEDMYGVLAHEFQHMIHWNLDVNETTWINEGFSDLAMLLNGYSAIGHDMVYIGNTDIQLNDWPNNENITVPHYGAAFLYLAYFLDRFGEDATQALVRDPANGFDGVENVLREINATDPLTGQPIHADDLFMDWAVTNFVLDPSVGDGQYVYKNYPEARRASAVDTISSCPQAPLTRDVRQYGVDYIAIQCAGDYTLRFTGSTITKLLPMDPHSGQYAFWSNKSDDSDMTLTREFDLSHVSGPITFSYQTWYDLEEDFDYVYLEVSEDGGTTWQITSTPSGTPDDPTGSSYGWGYNGTTNGWIEESVDLSQYAGKQILIRFEYITDPAVNGEGFLLDDISMSGINYQSDFEADEGGWAAEGFVRIQNVLPQTYRLALILSSDSTVQMIPLDEEQVAEIPISLQPGEQAILVVSGTTPFTREGAAYQIEIK
ncbi:MAG: choice-of-anchor J domain-containing protein [Chloroflexota bacterium]